MLGNTDEYRRMKYARECRRMLESDSIGSSTFDNVLPSPSFHIKRFKNFAVAFTTEIKQLKFASCSSLSTILFQMMDHDSLTPTARVGLFIKYLSRAIIANTPPHKNDEFTWVLL